MKRDFRINQNPALLTFAVLFYRWHNVLAARVQAKHPTWGDEDVFQGARRLNIAILQNIIAYEYLPAFLGESLPPYTGYKSFTHPGISNEFQSAAFRFINIVLYAELTRCNVRCLHFLSHFSRFGHTLIPPGMYRRDGKCNYKDAQDGSPAIRLCATWWDAQVNIQAM